ncbi:hypothetical protein ACHAXA_006381 [Cyclostephanos tholiformis]|uniref:BRCT domain-containing protein n=1 Tax=Cyclostephanos tholiformis TaxID=382380 RepID=A0ABD3SDW1_9STRA
MADEGDSCAGRNDMKSGDGPATAARSSPPPDDGASGTTSNARRGRNKRKRKRPFSTTRPKEGNEATATPRGDGSLFNGLIVALSALESKHDHPRDGVTIHDLVNDANVDDPYRNYKTLKQLLTTLGATVSPQVHKRVHCLISTECAVRNLTQRVRQAYRRNVDVVDASWVKDCREMGTRVDIGNYLCNDLVKCLLAEKDVRDGGSTEKIRASSSYDVGHVDDNAGWSIPVELDCCCVCHENGDDACPWCTGSQQCNLTLAMKEKAAKTCTKNPE